MPDSAHHRYTAFMRANLPNGGKCVCGADFEIYVTQAEVAEYFEREGVAIKDLGSNWEDRYWEHRLESIQSGPCCRMLLNCERRKGFICAVCQKPALKANQNALRLRQIDDARIQRQQRVNTLLHRDKLITSEFLEATFDASQAAKEMTNQGAWNNARKYNHRTSPNWWICGPTESGKSHMARCILNSTLDHCRVAEISGIELGTVAAWQIFDNLKHHMSVGLLLIDDVAQATFRDDAAGALMALFEARCPKLRTIITSNRTPGEFMAQLTKARPGAEGFSQQLLRRLNLGDLKCEIIPMVNSTGR